MLDRAKAFLVRAGTLILASMVVVWALLYFPATDEKGQSYDLRIAALQAQADAAEGEQKESLEREILDQSSRVEEMIAKACQALVERRVEVVVVLSAISADQPLSGDLRILLLSGSDVFYPSNTCL